MTGLVHGQLNPPWFVTQNPPPSSACGIVNPIISVVTPSPICYNRTVTIRLNYDIALDTIYLDFGDNKDITIVGASILPNTMDVTHVYTFTPADSCPSIAFGPPAISCIVKAYFFKRCGPSAYSYVSTTNNSMAFRFKPRVRFQTTNYLTNYVPGQNLLVACNTNCVQLDMSNCCTNTYIGTDSTDYWWSFGDGTPNDTFSNTPDGNFISPVHCYAHPSVSPAYYTIKLHAENECGVSEDWGKLYVQEIADVQVDPGPYCTGSAVGVHITASGGLGNPVYSTTVTPPGCSTIAGDSTANPQITFTCAGTFTINSAYGFCSETRTITVDQGVDMQQSPVPDDCYTGSNSINLAAYFFSSATTQSNHFSITDTAGAILFSATGSSVPSSSITLPHAGRYFVYDSSITTCNTVVFTDTFYLQPPLSIALPADTIVCLQTLFVLPNVPGAVRTLNGTPTTDTFYVYPAGVYTVTYTPISCGSSVSFTITTKGTESLVSDYTYCSSPGAIVLSGTQPNTLFSGPHISNDTLYGNAAGPGSHVFYSSYTAADGCIFLDTAQVQILSSINAGVTLPDTVCAGSPVTLSNIPAGLSTTTNWGDGTTDNNVTHTYNISGTMFLSIRFSDGTCDTTMTDTLLVIDAPASTFLLLPDTACSGDTVTIQFTPNTLYQQQWEYNGNTSLTPPVMVANNSSSAVICQTVTLSVSYPQCPTAVSSQPVCFYPATQAIADIDFDSVCSPLPVTIINNSIVGPGATYQWFKNGVLFSTTNAPLQQDTLNAYTTDTTYTYMLVVNSCGANDTVYQAVTVHPVNFTPVLYVSSLSPCRYDTILYWTSPITGCTANYNFGDGSAIQAGSADTISHIYTTEGNYAATVTMYCACKTKSDNLTIQVQPGPQLSVSDPVDTCKNQLVTINSSVTGTIAPGSYTTWFGDGATNIGSANPTHTYTQDGTYQGQMLVYGINGCRSDTATFSIDIFNVPNINTNPADTFACSAILTQLSVDTGTVNSTYVWNIACHSQHTQVTTYNGALPFYAEEAGEYEILLYAYNNNHPACLAKADSFSVTVYESPMAFFTVDFPYISQSEYVFPIHNMSTPNTNTYIWNFGDNTYSNEVNPEAHAYTAFGYYDIVLTARNGPCEDTALSQVFADPYLQLFIPNVFTPNSDGINDVFEIYGNKQDIDYLHVRVYNRIGEKVFDSYNLEFKWDGTYKSEPLVQAVYVYTVEISAIHDADKRLVKGSITLLR
ncbi:MAG: PKD domain-containing protein [Chitinophagales bacterium]